MEDIREYSDSLARSFEKLERALAELRKGSSGSCEASAADPELENKVHQLVKQNEALEQELLALRQTCDGLRVTYNELLERLNASIELVKSILERE